MFKVLKTEWLLTRKCSIACSYCKIKDSSSLRGIELTLDEVKIGVKFIHDTFPDTIIVFYGGEPTELKWLPDLISYCNEIGQYYAVISNSIKVMKDDEFFKSLALAGIKNWSVSIDSIEAIKGTTVNGPVKSNILKSICGMDALMKFKKYGVKDLVACITVTNKNIHQLPKMVKLLTKKGVWSITTPLQIGKTDFEYSDCSQETRDLKCYDEVLIKNIAKRLYKMAKSGKYLMHNDAEYYTLWEKMFMPANWKCSTGKNYMTVDADGSLRRCVDIKGGLERFSILTLKDNLEEYEKALNAEFDCEGCFWDPPVETTLRANGWTEDKAKKSYLHNQGG
jgi:MoaA/NifB/PqqE/SkfB family radical SAM enzyme